MSTKTLCRCCTREMLSDLFGGFCWECAGRPDLGGAKAPIAAGERQPECPHVVPGSKK